MSRIDRNDVITQMCHVVRPDYGIVRNDDDNSDEGMTIQEMTALHGQMEKLYDRVFLSILNK